MTSRATQGRADHPTAVLVLVLSTYLMIIVDTSVIITGLPQIQTDLGFTTAALLVVVVLVVRPGRVGTGEVVVADAASQPSRPDAAAGLTLDSTRP